MNVFTFIYDLLNSDQHFLKDFTRRYRVTVSRKGYKNENLGYKKLNNSHSFTPNDTKQCAVLSVSLPSLKLVDVNLLDKNYNSKTVWSLNRKMSGTLSQS